MKKKNYKGAKVSKRVVAKCEGVCKTYDAIQYAYANLLEEVENVAMWFTHMNILELDWKQAVDKLHKIAKKQSR